MPSIASLKKPELIQALRDLGEEPPASWKVTGLRVRLMELEEEQGITRHSGKVKTDLQGWVLKLNAAAKKKSNLQGFCQTELGLTVSMNETIVQLQKAAMERIYLVSKIDSTDPVGFGTHASLSYQEVQQQYPEYCQWVMKTAAEGQHNPRLGRLARWIQQNPYNPEETKNMVKEITPKSKAKGGGKSGYPPRMASTPHKEETFTETASSSSTAVLLQTQQMMTEMMKAVGTLKEEVEQLKEDRPRKKTAQEDGSSGYSMVTDLTKDENL